MLNQGSAAEYKIIFNRSANDNTFLLGGEVEYVRECNYLVVN